MLYSHKVSNDEVAPYPPPERHHAEETWEHMRETLGKPRNGSDTYMKTKKNHETFLGCSPTLSTGRKSCNFS